MRRRDEAGTATRRAAGAIRAPRPSGPRPSAGSAPRDTDAGGFERASGIERLCVQRGLKMTGQRRVVACVLSEADDHPDVEDVHRRAVASDERISIATVYRTVRLLEEAGILQRRDFGNGRARYEAAEHGHHHHLIDVETGKVVEFSDAAHERLVRALAERLGFEAVSIRLEVFGRRLGAEPASAPGRAGADGGAG